MSGFTLERLDEIVAARASAAPGTSYTRSLLDAGVDRCAKKLGEEGVEAAIAAVRGNPVEVAQEAADLLYHLAVMLRAAGVPLADVMAVLEARTAQSGLAEKASRKAAD